MFTPPYTPLQSALALMQQRGYVVLAAADVRALIEPFGEQLEQLESSWGDLKIDSYLKDGGRYRKRRHSSYVLEAEKIKQAQHRAHWQPLEYNALHGGMHRWFEPIDSVISEHPAWQKLIAVLPQLFVTTEAKKGSAAAQNQPWYIEAHQFRIDTEGGVGRPTPEGAHRDGVDFVAVFMIQRQSIKGGETRIFEAEGTNGQRFTLTEPWSVLLLDDARMIHETTTIQPLIDASNAHRDTLVVTYRRNGFIGTDTK